MLKKICLTVFLVFLLAVTAFSGTESAESKVADVDATATTGESGTADAELTGAAEIQSTMQADAAASESPAGQKSAEEIARELANPNTPLATLSLKNQYRKYDGDLPGADRQSNYSMLFQPTFPFALENGDVIFFRLAFPLLFDQPYFDLDTLDFDSDSGLGDIGADLGYGRTSKTGLLWAAGIVMSAPTATSSHFGSDRWTLGPELLIGKINPKSVFGIFPNHQWDVAGSSDALINRTSTQLFANYLPKGGGASALPQLFPMTGSRNNGPCR